MRRWTRIAIGVAVVLLLGVLFTAWLLYCATQSVPEFYEQALQVDPVKQKAASDQMVKQMAALASDVQREGSWQAVFTEEQINGWLAVDLVKNYGHLVPGDISNPRVAITPADISFGFLYEQKGRRTVISVAADAYLIKPNVVGLRLRKARAGLLPLPLDDVIKHLSRVTDELEWEIHWHQADGDPVAEITLPPIRDKSRRLVQVETLRLEDHRAVVAGTTKRN